MKKHLASLNLYITVFLGFITIQGSLLGGVWYVAIKSSEFDKRITITEMCCTKNAEFNNYVMQQIDQLQLSEGEIKK